MIPPPCPLMWIIIIYLFCLVFLHNFQRSTWRILLGLKSLLKHNVQILFLRCAGRLMDGLINVLRFTFYFEMSYCRKSLFFGCDTGWRLDAWVYGSAGELNAYNLSSATGNSWANSRPEPTQNLLSCLLLCSYTWFCSLYNSGRTK